MSQTKTIQVQDPPEVIIGYGVYVTRRPYYSGGRLPVRITKPCKYNCGKNVTFIRGQIFSGNDYHDECYEKSGEKPKDFDKIRTSILGSLTPSQYQNKFGVAWNE